MNSLPFCGRIAALVVLAALMCAPVRLRAIDQSAQAPSGLVYAVQVDSSRVMVPLESTEVVLDVKPGLLEAEVIQTFTNRTGTALEARYLYPLPGSATVTEFEVRYRDRVVRSEVREKGEARATYEQAKAEGRKTALLEQRDPSLFSTAIANFLPGETVHVVLRFIQPLDMRAASTEVRFPMVTGQKYFPAETAADTLGNGASDPARRFSGAMDPHHVYAFDISVSGFPIRQIESPSHAIRVAPASTGTERYLVSLAEEITLPDRDFVLRIETRADAPQSTVVMQETSRGSFGLVTVFPPQTPRPGAKVPRPRDVLFLIDRSGSMQGTRIESARRGLARCLDALAPADRFQIVLFDDRHDFYQPQWIAATTAELDVARVFVAGIQSRGGTAMQPALTAALATFEPNQREQIIIFLTDGDVGNEASLLNLLETRIGQVRLFAFGVGAVPNAALLRKMADAGRGQARFIADDASIERELTDLFATLDAPVLEQTRFTLLDAQGATIDRVAFPEKLPDLFLSRPVQSVFRVGDRRPAMVVVEGVEAGKPVTHRIPVQTSLHRGSGLEKQFGKSLYDDSSALLRGTQTEEERKLIRQEMLATALQFQLVTELTSRVAVDGAIARDPNAPIVTQNVAQYVAADQTRAYASGAPGGGDIVVLTPFSVASENDDRGYVTGVRRLDARSFWAATDVLPRQSIDDQGAGGLEDVSPFAVEPQQNPAFLRGGLARLDGLPIATVVDSRTVAEIAMRTIAFPWAEIRQLEVPRIASTSLRVAAGSARYAAVSLKVAPPFGAEVPAMAILSWSRLDHAQSSAFLAGTKTFEDNVARADFQSRDLDGYGRLYLARASIEHRFTPDLRVDATVAQHELRRQDPAQFRLGGDGSRYDGLGLFNLDLLTAETRGFSDTVVEAGVWNRRRGATSLQTWSLHATWHRQQSDWLAPHGDVTTPQRDTHQIELDYEAAVAKDRVHFTSHFVHSNLAETRTTMDHAQTSALTAGIDGRLGDILSVFGNAAREQSLPWISTGRWENRGSQRLLVEAPRDQRHAVETGVKIETLDRMVQGHLAVFRESLDDLTDRDWAWERAHAGSATVEVGGEMRSAVSTAQWPTLTREGWVTSWNFNPSRSVALKASYWQDWKNEGPTRGGNRRASFLGRYEARQGAWRGFTTSVGLSAASDLVFNDGYILPGGARADLMFAYRIRPRERRDAMIQLNLLNLTDRAWQATRFSRVHGREVRVTVSRGF